MPQTVSNTEKTSFLARLINSLGGAYLRLVPNALPMDADYLHEKAMKETGLTDFGDPHYREGLNVLLNDVNRNVQASFIGRLVLQGVLLRQLRNRLRFVEYKKSHPEVFEKPLHDPLLITGIPRSGTTFLHRLMGQDTRWRSLKLYEIQHPILPAAGQKDNRLAESAKELKPASTLIPELDSKHVVRADMPEECMWLMGITFCSMEYLLEMSVKDYLDWYQQHDRSQAYREYAQLLQIVQAQSSQKPLLLKAPAHGGSLDYLLAAIPDIQLVVAEREMISSLSSFCSLQFSVLRNNVYSPDKHALGAVTANFMKRENERQQAFLSQHPGIACKVHYEQIRRDPLTVVRNIYQHYNIPMTTEAEEKMTAYALMHPQHKYGVHRYSAEEFGVSKAHTNVFNDTQLKRREVS